MNNILCPPPPTNFKLPTSNSELPTLNSELQTLNSSPHPYLGMTAITFGVFDLLHYGHFELFRRIRELVGPTGKVIVLLQWDEWITKYKDVKIVYNFGMRKKMIEALRYVDEVVGYDTVGIDAAKKVDFNLLVRGPEHNSERFQKLTQWCLDNGKQYTILPRTEGISTTLLKKVIKDL